MRAHISTVPPTPVSLIQANRRESNPGPNKFFFKKTDRKASLGLGYSSMGCTEATLYFYLSFFYTFLAILLPIIVVFTCNFLIIHKLIFFLLVVKTIEDNFIYSIPLLYGLFSIFSVLIVGVLIKVKERNIDNVGYTFLLLTSIKLVVAYLLIHPILKASLHQTPLEKINFFIIFIYFLATETILTIRILNNK
jgi:hypothetical protein